MRVIAWSLNEKRPRNSAALKFITDHIGEPNKMVELHQIRKWWAVEDSNLPASPL